jgi:hypothetical protein
MKVYYIFLAIVGSISFYMESTCSDQRAIRLSAKEQELLIAQGQLEDQEKIRAKIHTMVQRTAPHCDIMAACRKESNNSIRAYGQLIDTEKLDPQIRTDLIRNATATAKTFTESLYALQAKQLKNIDYLNQTNQKPLGCSIL